MKDLMQPRVKIMLKYPDMPFKVGQVLYLIGVNNYYVDHKSINIGGWISVASVNECRFIFKPLPWHQERDISEMPEYVKLSGNTIVKTIGYAYGIRRTVLYAKYHQPKRTLRFAKGVLRAVPVTQISPATKEEYETFIKGATTND